MTDENECGIPPGLPLFALLHPEVRPRAFEVPDSKDNIAVTAKAEHARSDITYLIYTSFIRYEITGRFSLEPQKDGALGEVPSAHPCHHHR